MQHQSNIDQFHTYLNSVLSALLESQVRTRSFITAAQQYKDQAIESRPAGLYNQSQLDWKALLKSNTQLVKLGTSSWERSIHQIKSLIVECDHLVRELHKAMIDRELYEQQGLVLQGIILSHEKIENWEEFVQSILLKFHAIFEFNFFSIAFDTQDGIDLYLYYMGTFTTEAMVDAKNELSTHLASGLSNTKKLTIKEYQVLDIQLDNIDINQMHSVTVDVNKEQDNLGGLFEMGYFSSAPRGIDEESIIKSILSVMIMVIGSSRTLKTTLTELDYRANQDPLTGLYNRRYFNSFLEKETERSKRHNHEFCLLLLDLDNFKGINDSYGHLCGDTVLRDIAGIIKKNIRLSDLATRLGGDEFAIVLPETNSAGAHHVADEIIKAIEIHQFSSKHNLHLTASIGLVAYPAHSTSITEMLSNVDIALYQAKADGRNTIRDYDSSIQAARSSGRLFGLSLEVTHAIKENRIIPYFQPIVSTIGQSVYAYEALARLVREDGEIVPAEIFITALEQSGVITSLDQHMIQIVTNTMLTVAGESKNYPLVFINLSPASIQNCGILQYASTICTDKGIPPHCIVFEMTEREVISDLTSMKYILSDLRDRGFAFALDDFGSGYNSFQYLRELHFEYIKIDGEFVRNMLNNKADHAVIESIYSLCEKLEMKTIAEFVEDNEILTRLQQMGVTYCQGFHTGFPSANICH